ncbi:MAG TPA: choice-of-anchor V domain-containing protein [Bacteroidia bacterium]|jgi:hypothetical protein|nr:choice-of-anchor V domain-containing protein [Bacteroidia bacterium]
MKKSKLFITLGIVAAGLSISAFTLVHASGMSQYTDSPPDGPGDCSGCHSGGSAIPVVSFTASPAFGSGTTYMPGVTYTISLKVTGYPDFGFDLEMLNGNTATSVDAGTFSTPGSKVQIIPASGGVPTNMTHSSRIASTGAATWVWKAPASGKVYVYAACLGANGDGSTGGDKTLPVTYIISPSPTAVQSLSENNTAFSFFPNPASDQIHLTYSLDKMSKVNICIYDLNGKLAATLLDQNQEQGQQSFDASLPAGLTKGVYTLNLTVDGQATAKKLLIR